MGQQSPLLTKKLPTYETKCRMTVRSDCTKDPPVVDTIPKGTRVYLLETGIEKFPTNRLCHWWRKTFADMNMDYVEKYIRQRNVDGRELSAFSAETRLKLELYQDQHECIRKALKLVKRKAQVVFFDEYGMPQRGWISKVKKGKQQISRIFQKTTPTLCVKAMNTRGWSIAECETFFEELLQLDLSLNYEAIKMATYFDQFRHGDEYVMRKGRRRHGKWRPGNHCLIEFASYNDAAVALNAMSSCDALRQCEVDFALEYANLTEVTFPRY